MKTKPKRDIKFIKEVAKMYNLQISDKEARRAHKIVSARSTPEEYYTNLKEYFLN